jgi:tRNA A-37 threonylcarbamoyl transferase component Bud32/tetratricopeptide (TPR) repeat protein
MIGTTVSHYLVTDRLGGGGMAVVYEAQDVRLPRRVALKFLHDQLANDAMALTRFKREAAALSLLNHPNICTIHEVDAFEGQPFIAMEKLEGRTLRARLAEGPIECTELVDIAAQIAQALKAAHEKGIVHRDIKPGNIFITTNGVKVLDFGLAKFGLGTEEQDAEDHTVDGRPVGTANYMSPECIRQDDLDPRSDLFSLGVVIFEMAAGFPPFEGGSVAQTVANVFDQDPPALTEVASRQPGELQSIVQKLLARDPTDRYQTAGALLRDLKALAIRIDVQAGTPRQAAAGAHASAGARSGQISIVVMPTRVLGEEADLFLADAIPNAISKRLLKVPGIETKRPPTTGDLERVAGDLDQVARVYGATAYVVSLLNISGGRFKLSVQLVDTASRGLRWCDEYKGSRKAYTGIVKAAAEGIRRALQPDREPPPPTTSGIINQEAELLLQQGLYHLNLFRNLARPGDFERAETTLRHAADLEPQRPDAPAALALLHSARLRTGASPSQVIPECETWVKRTLEIDQRNSKAWAIRCELEMMRSDLRKPFEYGLKAAAFGERDAFAHARLASCLMWHSFELSLLAASEGARVDPLVLDAPMFAAISLHHLNRRDEALSLIDVVLEIEPDMILAQFTKGLLLADAGRTGPALEIMARLEPIAAKGRLLPQWLAIFKDVAAYHDAAQAGDTETLARTTQRLASVARGENQFPRWELTTSGIARLLARRSPELSLELFAHRSKIGMIAPYDHLVAHPDLDPLRGDERFQQLLRASRRNFEETLSVARAAQSRAEAPDYIVHALDDLSRRFQLSPV